MNYDQIVYDEIRSHAQSNKSVEVCGIIKDNKIIRCENLSPCPEDHFSINPIDILTYEPDCIYHSHPKTSSSPSQLDRISQEESDIPYLIYSVIDDDFYFLKK